MNLSIIDVIRGGAYGTMSDAQLDCERGIQMRLDRAIAEMRAALECAAEGSEVMSIDRTGFEDYLHDASLLDFKHWDEMIARARNP